MNDVHPIAQKRLGEQFDPIKHSDDHPIDVKVGHDYMATGMGSVVASGEADDLSAALRAAQTLCEESPEVSQILVTLKPGWRLVNGQLYYSADWLS